VRIVVTGATGGIGQGLVSLLAARGLSVVATGRNPVIGRSLETPQIRFVPLDLVKDDLGALVKGAAIVIHLAARSSPWGPASAFEADNVVATMRLLNAAASAGVSRFVFASSPSIFAGRNHRLNLQAGSPPALRPANAYARTKLAAERLVLAERRMTTMVLRPSAVIGPNDKAILPRLLRILSRGLLPVGNGGLARFHPTDARDAAEAFCAAALGSGTGALNIAGAEPIGVADMAERVAQRLGVRLRVRHVPEPALHALAATAELVGSAIGREPPFTRYSAATLSWSRTFDLAEAQAALGWAPAFGPLDALESALPR
jgi:nucleoside-diphosphate-sugar epimerase